MAEGETVPLVEASAAGEEFVPEACSAARAEGSPPRPSGSRQLSRSEPDKTEATIRDLKFGSLLINHSFRTCVAG